MATTHFSFNTLEKLKSKKDIDFLFEHGITAFAHPYKFYYHIKPIEKTDQAIRIKAGVAVSAKKFKHAVARNTIKRYLRELYRLHKYELYNALPKDQAMHVFIMYIGNEMPTMPMLLPYWHTALIKLKNAIAR
jgi:ribonuclease P protein component